MVSPGEESVFISGFVVGILLVVVCAVVPIMNCKGISIEEIKTCEALCNPNGGLKYIYPDKDCECENKAEFSYPHVLPERPE